MVVTFFVFGGNRKSLPKTGPPLQLQKVQYSRNPIVANWEKKNRLRLQNVQTNQSKQANQITAKTLEQHQYRGGDKKDF